MIWRQSWTDGSGATRDTTVAIAPAVPILTEDLVVLSTVTCLARVPHATLP
jgi:hypothetical protein